MKGLQVRARQRAFGGPAEYGLLALAGGGARHDVRYGALAVGIGPECGAHLGARR